MEMNLGKLIQINFREPIKSDAFTIMYVTWIFEFGEIRGGRITKSIQNKNGLWVQLPKYRAGSTYISTIKLYGEELREFLEKKTLEDYLGLYPDDKSDNKEEEIDLDKIPF